MSLSKGPFTTQPSKKFHPIALNHISPGDHEHGSCQRRQDL